jgi:hypothetical protein
LAGVRDGRVSLAFEGIGGRAVLGPRRPRGVASARAKRGVIRIAFELSRSSRAFRRRRWGIRQTPAIDVRQGRAARRRRSRIANRVSALEFRFAAARLGIGGRGRVTNATLERRVARASVLRLVFARVGPECVGSSNDGGVPAADDWWHVGAPGRTRRAPHGIPTATCPELCADDDDCLEQSTRAHGPSIRACGGEVVLREVGRQICRICRIAAAGPRVSSYAPKPCGGAKDPLCLSVAPSIPGAILE